MHFTLIDGWHIFFQFSLYHNIIIVYMAYLTHSTYYMGINLEKVNLRLQPSSPLSRLNTATNHFWYMAPWQGRWLAGLGEAWKINAVTSWIWQHYATQWGRQVYNVSPLGHLLDMYSFKSTHRPTENSFCYMDLRWIWSYNDTRKWQTEDKAVSSAKYK